MQAAVRPDNLTQEQASVIAEAMRIQKTLTEEELLRQLKEFVNTCTDVTPELPGSCPPNERSDHIVVSQAVWTGGAPSGAERTISYEAGRGCVECARLNLRRVFNGS